MQRLLMELSFLSSKRTYVKAPQKAYVKGVVNIDQSLLLRFSVTCIVVAILGYGMMSMYWCCRLSFESGCCSVSWPWGEVARDRAHGSLACQRPYKPHRSRGSVTFLLLETQNNHPMQSTASSTNTCSPFHRKGQRSQCRTGVCCRSGRLLSRCFLPCFFSSPDRLFLP